MSDRSYGACPADCECDDCHIPKARRFDPGELAVAARNDVLLRAWAAEDEARRAERRQELTVSGGWPPPQFERPAKFWGRA